jgi:aminopeptidase-like protein
MTDHGPFVSRLDRSSAGNDMFALAADIFPICRSITGDGVRETLRCLGRHIPIEMHEVASGGAAFDWSVPMEWNIRDAFIKNASGERVLDFRRNNLHVVSYSTPVQGYFRLEDLKKHIFSLPEQPDLIPYRTSYHQAGWGFCMTHNQLMALADGVYEVQIDSCFDSGSLTYGEYFHRGEREEEILLSTHICHPSMANDNCSGIALLAYLAERLIGVSTRYSYRFVFAPGTIGAIVWLSRNEDVASRIAHGLVVSCVGDGGGPTYKKSRRGNAGIDRAMAHVLRHATPSASVREFSPYGSDERQFCSPGFNLPVGSFHRSPLAGYPEYHTSGDDLDLIRPAHLASSYRLIVAALNVLENDAVMLNTSPKCEPQLGRRGLRPPSGGREDDDPKGMALLWVLNLSDGGHSLFDIAERADLPFAVIAEAAKSLEDQRLLEPTTAAPL